VIRTLRRWWQQPDHYYFITASLAAHGLQSGTSRFISAIVLARGLLPVVMLWSPAGPQGRLNAVISSLVAASSLLVALCWQRRRWPSRKQSLMCAGILAGGIAASTVTRANPVSGVVAAMAFAALAGYIVFFHTARYLILMLVVAAATILVPVTRLAAKGDVVWAGCLLALCAIVIIAVASLCQVLVHLLGIKILAADIEPVTGLLNRSAFYDAAGTLCGSRSRLSDRYLAIVVVRLDHLALLTQSGGAAAVERARVAAGQALRETTRHDAIVAHLPDDEFLVADSFVTPDVRPLIERISGGLRATPLRQTASIGVVRTPMRALASCAPYDLVDELVTLATEAADDAHRSGGNAVSYVTCDHPAALDDLPDRRGAGDSY
jgi:GGDEF domain-containing protein